MEAAFMLAAASSSPLRSAAVGGSRTVSVAPVLRFGRAQLWGGCIFFFYCCMLTLMATVSNAWIVTPSTVDNDSCQHCASWSTVRGRDVYQTRLLAAAIVLGFTGYVCIALRWFAYFALYPVLKLVALLCLSAVIALDFAAYVSYHNDYGASTVYANAELYFGTGYDWSQTAAIYGCIALALLLWQEVEELRVRRRMVELRRRKEALDASARSAGASPPPTPHLSPRPLLSYASGLPGVAEGRRLSSSAFSAVGPLDRCGLVLQPARLESDSVRLKFSLKDQLSPIQRRLVLGANLFLVLLYLGGWLISTLEGWAIQDGVNYILASWCTLGYGNYVPTTTGGRLFMYAYWPIGFAVISSTSATLWRVFLFRVDRTLRRAGEIIAGKRRRGGHRSRRHHALRPITAETAAQTGDDTEHERRQRRHSSGYPALTDIVFTAPEEHNPHQQPQHEQHQAGGGVDADSSGAQALAVTISMPSAHSEHSHSQQQEQQEQQSVAQRHQQTQTTAAGFHLRSVPAPPAFEQLPSLATVFAPLKKEATSSSAEDAASPVSAQAARSSPSPAPSAATALSLLSPPPPPGHTLSIPAGPERGGGGNRSSGGLKVSGRTSSPQPEPLHVRFPSLADSGRTIPPTMLREDFLQYLKRQTSRRQLHRDIETELESHRQHAADGEPDARHTPLPHSEQQQEEAEQGRRSPSSLQPQSAAPPPAIDSPASRGAHGAPVTFTPFSSYVGGGGERQSSAAARRSSLFLKLTVAVLCVMSWICLSGGVYVWSEEQQYSYFDCQWSAFNLLTTISVGTFATPFTTPTSTYFVWFQLIGIGTLAYSFALIAEISALGLDDGRKARSRRRNSSNSSSTDIKHGSLPPAASAISLPTATVVPAQAVAAGQAAVTAGTGALVSHDATFVSHAKELDQFILELIEKQSGLQQTADALLRSPVLLVGASRGQAADGKEGERVELPLEGVSLLLRYHLAFQAFEQARQEEKQRQKARREERASRRKQRRRPRVSTDGAASDVRVSGDGLSAREPGSATSSLQSVQLLTVPQQPTAAAGASGRAPRAALTAARAGGRPSVGSESGTTGDEVDDEDLRFDWSNTTDWIEQAGEEVEEKEEVQAELEAKSASTDGGLKGGNGVGVHVEQGKLQQQQQPH